MRTSSNWWSTSPARIDAEFCSFFWMKYLYGYLDYTAETSQLSPGELMKLSDRVAAENIVTGSLSATGGEFKSLIKRLNEDDTKRCSKTLAFQTFLDSRWSHETLVYSSENPKFDSLLNQIACSDASSAFAGLEASIRDGSQIPRHTAPDGPIAVCPGFRIRKPRDTNLGALRFLDVNA